MGRHKLQEIPEGINNILYIEAKRQNMRDACRLYRRQPIHEMTDQEARAFAIRQAKDASLSIPMDKEEVLQYTDSILEAINYFNARDEKHRQHIQYVNECQRMEQYAAQLRSEEKKRQKGMQIIIK